MGNITSTKYLSKKCLKLTPDTFDNCLKCNDNMSDCGSLQITDIFYTVYENDPKQNIKVAVFNLIKKKFLQLRNLICVMN